LIVPLDTTLSHAGVKNMDTITIIMASESCYLASKELSSKENEVGNIKQNELTKNDPVKVREPKNKEVPKTNPTFPSPSTSRMENIWTIDRHVVPADNSCLFRSISYAIFQETDSLPVEIMRELACAEILENTDKYNEAILGKSVNDYVTWLKVNQLKQNHSPYPFLHRILKVGAAKLNYRSFLIFWTK
jgi:hypothetical protein